MEGKTPMRILLVDNDIQWGEAMASYLSQGGFEVLTAVGGAQALKVYKKASPEFLLLNIFLSDIDGVEICERIRALPSEHNPVIILLAEENQDYALLAGFEAGADDFIYKDIKPKLFLCKLRALAKLCIRQKEQKTSAVITYGDLALDREAYRATRGREELLLTKKEFELFALLISQPNRVFTRTEIARLIWADEKKANGRTIDVHILRLREKTGVTFKAVKGVGYKIEKSEE